VLKRTNYWVVIRDLDAANLQPALEHGCRKQTPGASILIFSTNLVNVHHIKMLRRIRSRFLHDFDACKEHAAAQCQHPTNIVANDVFDSDSIFFIFVFLVAKPQLNYWTQWMVRTQLIIRKLRLYIHVG